MGLAPYAPAGSTDRAAAALRVVFDFADGRPCRFEWRKRGPLYRALLEATLGLRFDWVAGGAQRIVEESLLAWARRMRERYGGERLALGGGVFMNVKANMLLADEPWASDLFVFPSCGDESNAVGAAYLGYLERCARQELSAAPRPFGPAYLGPGIDDGEVETVVRRRDLAARHRVSEPPRMEERIAELLASDGVVARCAGRMEFGARALGNRSILANPSDHRVVPLINRMIKNRDFWMPFAPSVLREREADYLVNPKRSEEHTSELQSPCNLVCRLLLEKKKICPTDFYVYMLNTHAKTLDLVANHIRHMVSSCGYAKVYEVTETIPFCAALSLRALIANP